MMNDKDKRLAVLIDADNVSPKYIQYILDELVGDGTITYKRIYGDWTKPSLASWKTALLGHSILPVQQYGYTTGKNATDSAMIIDAMDILYSGNVEGFCLVSSDSDFTRLAARLRESGMYVVGMGEKKTPLAFIAACNKFKYLEVLEKAPAAAEPAEPPVPAKTSSGSAKKAQQREPAAVVEDAHEMTSLKTIKASITAMVEELCDEGDWIPISEIGTRLVKRYPDFDTRNYGFSKLTPFVRSLNIVDIRSDRTPNGNRLVSVRPKWQA